MTHPAGKNIWHEHPTRFGQMLALWRWEHHLGVRDAAREIGLSPTTYSRIENGKPMDVPTLEKLVAWLRGPAPERGAK